MAEETVKEEVTTEAKAEVVEEPERVLTYVRILPGEKIEDVAKRFNTTIEQILQDNKTINPDYIQPNQWVFI